MTKKTLQDNGFVIIDNVFRYSELKPAIDVVNEITDYFSNEKNDDPFNEYCLTHRVDNGVLFDLYSRHPEFQKLVHNERLLSHLKDLIDENLLLYENTLIFKPKGQHNEVPWHQDFMDRVNEPEKYVIWIALDKVHKGNGALKFINGSHKLGRQKWYKVKGAAHHTRLKLDGIDVSNYSYGELNPGDVLIFHHLLIHSSDRVNVEEPRRAFRFSVQTFDEIYSPRGIPIVIAGGRPKSSYDNAKSHTSRKPKGRLILEKLMNKYYPR